MSLENLKLSKELLAIMLDAGFHHPSEIQAKTISRILGGQSILGIAPKESGKTTATVLAVLHRLKGPVDGAPRALIIAPDRNKVAALLKLFKWLGRESGIRVSCLAAGVTTDLQSEAIEDGLADVIIGTPDKVNALYVKSSLNLRSLIMFVLDDAETMVKLGQQALIYQLSDGIIKAQRVVYTELLEDKLERLCDYIMAKSETLEAKKGIDKSPELTDQILYQVPNYKLKISLMEYIIRQDKSFKKAVVFMNNRINSDVLYKTLKKRVGNSIGILKHITSNESGFASVEAFRQSAETRVLVLSIEDQPSFNLLDIQYIIHFELPEEKNIFISRVKKLDNNEAISLTLATNNEVVQVKKIEQFTGKTMQIKELPNEIALEVKAKSDLEDEMPAPSLKAKTKNGGEDWDMKIK